jgi:large subunit ribosomal protein L21
MYAVIETGGKQYKVVAGEVVKIEKLPTAEGEKVEFNKVLMASTEEGPRIGAPLLSGARVVGTVLNQERDRKVVVFKKKRRKTYRRTKGHRQSVTRVRIDTIEV